MKITLKYEENESEDLNMTLRLTLPGKYVEGPAGSVVKLFVDHYNKKHAETPLNADELHLKIVGGDHLTAESKVADTLKTGDECYLLGKDWQTSSKGASSSKPAAGYAADRSDAAAPAASSAAPVEKKQEKKPEGHLRCKRYGCNRYFDPNGPEQPCKHHKAPPIFHEVAKYWSCCPDKKAYDWDEFMKIPGCQSGFCSANPEGQVGNKALGGADLRGDTAPQRIDADAPEDPRKKIAELVKGLIAVGVDRDLLHRVWTKLANDCGEDHEKVAEKFRTRFSAVLNATV